MTQEVENSMNYYPLKFVMEIGIEITCVFFDTIDAYKQITGYSFIIVVIEGNNICIIIMVQIFSIDIK